MKINFKTIEIEGFRSIVKNLSFNLNKPGLNLIKGINGAGKTSVFEGLYWAVYGENLKESNNDKLPTKPRYRTSQWKGTRVAVVFQIENSIYEITRCIGYKGLINDVKGEDHLFLIKDNKIIGDFRNKTEIQQEINRILGMSANVFINSVLFGQRMAKLVSQSGSDKRELFETLFETEWVGRAKIKCDADITTWTQEMSMLNTNVQLTQNKIESLQDKVVSTKLLINGFEVGRATRLVEKKAQLSAYQVKLTGFNAELVGYQEAQDLIKYDAAAHTKIEEEFNNLEKQFNEANLAQVTHNSKLTTAQNLVTTKKSDVTRLQAELDKLKAKHIEGNCPYCEQELREGNKLEINHTVEILSATGKVQNAEVLLKEAEKALKALQRIKAPATPESITKEKEVVEEQLTAMDALLADYNAQVENIKGAETDKTQAEKDITRVTKEIEDIKAEKPPVVDIKNIELFILQEQDKLKTTQQEKLETEHKLEIAEWWSKKALSSSGLKAYIFTAMLTQLNQNVKKYGDRLGASLEFSIDLTKASKPFITKCSLGDAIDEDYKDFSGGEKDRLDICLMFGLYDVISMNSNMNLLIMDEPFSGLDEEGETIVFDLVREKTESGKSVYVITHSPTLDSLYANKIEFTKINGNTVIIN
jgi:DNA repair exonuclease SbcCD ATPase subunit